MRLAGTRRARPALSMTSLIDVIFLLLLFFMLTSTFVRHQEVQIASPNAEGAVGGSLPDVLLRAGANGSLRLNGAETDAPSLVAQLAELRAAGGETLLVSAGEDADSQTLVEAVEAARRAGFTSVAVAD